MAEWQAEEHDCAARAGNAELVGRLLAEAECATARARAFRLGEWAVGQLAGVITRTALGAGLPVRTAR